jgi:choline-glycine betaine transporter
MDASSGNLLNTICLSDLYLGDWQQQKKIAKAIRFLILLILLIMGIVVKLIMDRKEIRPKVKFENRFLVHVKYLNPNNSSH